MADQPIPTYPTPAPPPPPAARSSRKWLFIALGLFALCLLACCAISLLGGGSIFAPVMSAAQLPTECEQNSGLDAQACANWTTGVAGTAEFQACIQEGMSSGQNDVDSLYACLVDKGVGP